MPPPDLHEVIEQVLREADRSLTSSEISDIIINKRLWRRPSDGQFPEASQISARVNNYRHLFEKQERYIFLKKTSFDIERMFRLTWNTSGWQYPVPHKWKKSNQGKKNIAFENQFGFGGEEWLFNPRYMKDGYQYGFIRGVNDLASGITLVSRAWLFSINQDTGERFIVGQINELEVIKEQSATKQIAERLYDRYQNEIKAELADVKADKNGLNYGLIPNVRFRITGEELFEEMRPAPWLEGRQHNRFIPYTIDEKLQPLIDGTLDDDSFYFNPGVAKSSRRYGRITSPSNRTIERVHSEISEALEHYLKPEFSRGKKNLSIEKTCFGNNIADVVLDHQPKEVTIMEIKTSGLARKNIRVAVGQLLDYGCWYGNFKIRRLIIVAPSDRKSVV